MDPLAETILQQLARFPESAEIVLGGYLALQHYVDYRQTHDIDAWWRERALPATENAIRQAMQEVAAREGYAIQERRFGETMSWELVRQGKKCFSFQIAVRSVTLEPAVPSPWPPILMETLHDNIGSKMNALVDRGAPRDFLDIKQIVQQGLAATNACWDLWARKNAGQSVDAAKQKVQLHLAALEMRRPLEAIADSKERTSARQTREWFRQEFLRVET